MRESAAYLCTKMCVAACVCVFKKVPTSARCSVLELLYWTSVIRELMWEKWTKDFRVIALFVSNYKEIQAYIKQTKLPSLNVSSKITMKDCFFCATIKPLHVSWLVLSTAINQEQQHCLMDRPPPPSFSYVSILFDCLAFGFSADL